MYHCHAQVYFVGDLSEVAQAVEELTPPRGFVYSFTQSALPDKALAGESDVIFYAPGEENYILGLDLWKKPGARLILVWKRETPLEEKDYEGADDIWYTPFAPGELAFRLGKWQAGEKAAADAWEVSQFLETTINSSPDLVWYKTKDGIHEKVNDSFCATVEKEKSVVEGRGHAFIWNVEQDDPACIESERIVMESRKTCVSEEIIQAGGETKILTTYKSPLYDLDGGVMGTVGVAIDVTKEHAYHKELVRKNQTLETIFTSMDWGIICHTLDGSEIISVNQAALRILGYENQEEMIEDGFFTVARSVVDEDKERLRDAIHSLKTLEDSASLEYRVAHKDGRLIYVLGTLKLLEGENGELYYQRFLMDITAQKKQQELARMEEERRQIALIHALSMDYSLVCFFDLDTGAGRTLRIGDCKEGVLQEIFSGELDFKDCMGRYIDHGVYKDDKEDLRTTVTPEVLLEELSQQPFCYRNYRTTCCGELRYFQLKVVRAGDWGQNHGVVVGVRSVDEETRIDREKNTLLEDALSQANQANRAKTTFLSNMSHDIRTPMNAIIGFTTLALTHIEKREQVEEYLKKIMTSGNHLLSLINDILDMSRIENGKIRLEEHECSLPEILHGLRNIIQADVHNKQLDLFMDAVDIQDEEIFCDRLRLNQVLLNLLSNAVKYTGAGGMVSVKVIQRAGAPKGFANYEFHVKDTGIGMSEEFLSHIFEPFERERNSTISGIQGTGLGMAITKSIVDMMGGSIVVRSKQTIGTECIVSFTFRLCQEKKKVPTEIPELANLRALVVDDDFNTCDSVSCMLQQIGLRAEWTMSGKEAVLRTRQAVMRDDHYSVYIIDWLLPDMNGVEVARRVRQEVGKEVPIIVLTAYDWSDIEDEAREAGVSAFCSKPIFLSELRDCLSEVVGIEKEEEKKEERPRIRHSGHILLAEDNELNREIATAILEEEGFTLESAENGAEAVELLKRSGPGHFDLILMDVQMPEMDGYEATRTIRALEDKKLADIPILAMTANAFEEDKREALQSGMNGHIAKPIDIDKLFATLDEVLG